MSLARILGKENWRKGAFSCTFTYAAQQAPMMRVHSVVAFAGRSFQAARVRNVDATPAVTNHSRQLQRMGDNRNRVALHADQLCHGFLGQR